MAAPEWDWFQREELIGQISDIRVQNLQVERENVQKRTFTRWINLHLEKCDPPLEVRDLFVDIQDGKILMALLEVLSGRDLLHEYKASSHRIFRLNNIAKALQFLEESSVRLVSIDAAEIADGNPSLVLGLIWNIIVFFQIKELTGNLSRNSPPSSLSPGSGGTDSDSSFPPTPTTERSLGLTVKDQRKAIRTLLAWVQRKTRKYGVAVQDFTGSWRSGLAFLAVIKAIDPSLVDMKQALEEPMRENLERAFSIAHDALHIPRLLEPEDIMVDTPDEQSIVTYVAQFLEHFPEVDPDEAVDSDREAPIESTFVRIKEARAQPEGKVLLLSENGEQTYTVNHEAAHPRPSRVFVPDQSASAEESSPPESSDSDVLADSPPEMVGQVLSHILSGVTCKNSSSGGGGGGSSSSSNNAPLPESSILSCRKENRRSSSLPVRKTVHFEADVYDTSCSQDSFYSQKLERSPQEAGEQPCQDAPGLAPGLAEEVEEEDRRPKPEATPDVIPRELASVTDADELAQGSPSPPPWNGMASPGKGDDGSLLPVPDSTVLAPTLELPVPLLTTPALAEEGGLEGIPPKASRLNSDLVDSVSTSLQPPSKESVALKRGAAPEEPERAGKRSCKSAHMGPEEPAEPAEPEEPPEAAAETGKAEVYEKAKSKSPSRRRRRSLEDSTPQEPGAEFPTSPPVASASLETLQSHSQDGLDLRRSPPLSKISVIPHELFYYPHYEVPLSAVLEAFAEGSEDLRNEEEEGEEEEDPEGLGVLGPGAQDEDQPADSDQEPSLEEEFDEEAPMPKPTLPTPAAAQPPSEAPVESSQEPCDSDTAAKPVEAKAVGESTSTKKKEKRKHVGCVDSALFTAPPSGRSSEDLEEDASEYRVQSRTSHSDSSIYIRRHTNRSLESDHYSYVQLRNAADVDDRRNRMLNRKAASSGETMAQETQAPRSDSLTRLVQQPDTMYFVLFLWLLVYCLLLFPQLDVSRL